MMRKLETYLQDELILTATTIILIMTTIIHRLVTTIKLYMIVLTVTLTLTISITATTTFRIVISLPTTPVKIPVK